jgi:copper resistance protein C
MHVMVAAAEVYHRVWNVVDALACSRGAGIFHWLCSSIASSEMSPSSRRLIVAALLLLVTPVLVFAHARLLRSTPSAGARLETAPASIRLVFSETPMVAVSRIVLLAANSDTIRLSGVRVDPADHHAILADVPASLDSGKYTVHWSAAASDGHPSKGSFTFTIGRALVSATAERAAAPVAPIQEKPLTSRSKPMNDAVQFALGAPMWIARWIGFISLFLVIGAVSFRYVVLGRIPRSDIEPDESFYQIATISAATTGMIAVVVLVVTSVL